MKIRTAGPADADEILQVRNQSWRSAYSGILDDGYLASLSDVPSESLITNLQHPPPHFTTLVAERGFDVVGFVTVAPYRTGPDSEPESADPGEGAEVWALYVLPHLWGRGTGRALMAAGLDLLAESGLTATARLWTLEDNAVGRRFYDRYGFVLDGETKEMTFGEQRLKAVRYVIDVPQAGS